jgi:hypothetical protein
VQGHVSGRFEVSELLGRLLTIELLPRMVLDATSTNPDKALRLLDVHQ